MNSKLELNSSISGKGKLIYYIFFIVTAIGSFRLFSILYTEHYHSDHAIHVLMSYYLDLPGDLYYWGQDRLGSLLPVISHPFVKLGIKPIYAVAAANFAFLVSGCLLFCSLFQTIMSKILFSIVWFFPLVAFKEFLYPAHPDSIQLFLLSFILVLIKKDKVSLLHHAVILALVSTAVWISETSISFLVAYSIHFFFFKKHRVGSLLGYVSVMVVSLIILALFLSFAKKHAVPVAGYLTLNSLGELAEMVLRVSREFMQIISGDQGLFYSAGTALAALILVLGAVKLCRNRDLIRKEILVLLITSVILLIVTFSSNWVLVNQNGARYFILWFYVSFFLAIYVLERVKSNSFLTRSLIISFVLCAAISSIQTELSGNSPHATYQELLAFRDLGKIAVIGDYWHSYNIASVDPENIIATPNDQELVRSQELQTWVLDRSEIFFVRDYWLENFPETISQFGVEFKKNGDEFQVAGYQVCKYIKSTEGLKDAIDKGF